MKKTILGLTAAGLIASGLGAAPTALAGPCPGLPALGNICTPRNGDDAMKPYEGKKGPQSVQKKARTSAGAPGS